MIRLVKKSWLLAYSITMGVFAFIPGTFFDKYILISELSTEWNGALTRILLCILMFVISMLIFGLYFWRRKSIVVKGNNYNIVVEYEDLFKMKDCKKVITFDECFTTKVGNLPAEVKLDSICGQFLKKHPIDNMSDLIHSALLKPDKRKSKYQSKEKYESGKLIPYNDYLLMAFAKLDKDGLGRLTRSEFIDCLSLMWIEIDKHRGYSNVCIPILGSGITRMDEGAGASLTQQELLDIIIWSYRLNSKKIKTPYKLYIVCKRCKGFSLNEIGNGIYNESMKE